MKKNYPTIIYTTNMTSLYTICPDIDTNLMHKQCILQGPQDMSFTAYPSTSYSNASATFAIVPPSKQVYIDKCIYVKQPISIQFTGSTTGTPAVLLLDGRDAPRAFPLASIINNLQLTINNSNFPIQCNEIVPVLEERYKKYKTWSMSPCFADTFTDYATGYGSNNNPLGTYRDSVMNEHVLRGGFPVAILSNTSTTANIAFEVIEPLYVGPLVDTPMESVGFTGVSTFTVTLNYANLPRCWSHDPSSPSTITAMTVTLGQPIIFMRYFTPPPSFVPMDMTYKYQDINRYTTGLGSTINAGATLASAVSSSIQLQSVPSKVFIWVQQSNLVKDYTSTDTFCQINGISINFNNRSGILASASKQDLFEINKKNHCNLTWNEWNGISETYNGVTGYGTVGGVLCLTFGDDIPLNDNTYVGQTGAFNFQFTLNGITNTSALTNMTQPVIYCVVVDDGRFIIHAASDGLTEQIKGILPPVGEPSYIAFNTYNEYYGGSFKDFISNAWNFIKDKASNVIGAIKNGQLISKGLSLIPHPLGQVASTVASTLGLGEGAMNAAGLTAGGRHHGGRETSRKELLRKLGNI